METYVYEVLIRQQIADSNRAAALRHLVRAARAPRAPSRWRAAIQWFVSGTTRADQSHSASTHDEMHFSRGAS